MDSEWRRFGTQHNILICDLRVVSVLDSVTVDSDAVAVVDGTDVVSVVVWVVVCVVGCVVVSVVADSSVVDSVVFAELVALVVTAYNENILNWFFKIKLIFLNLQ